MEVTDISLMKEEHKELIDFIDLKLEDYYGKMENMHIREGLFIVMRFSERGNIFLQNTA